MWSFFGRLSSRKQVRASEAGLRSLRSPGFAGLETPHGAMTAVLWVCLVRASTALRCECEQCHVSPPRRPSEHTVLLTLC